MSLYVPFFFGFFFLFIVLATHGGGARNGNPRMNFWIILVIAFSPPRAYTRLLCFPFAFFQLSFSIMGEHEAQGLAALWWTFGIYPKHRIIPAMCIRLSHSIPISFLLSANGGSLRLSIIKIPIFSSLSIFLLNFTQFPDDLINKTFIPSLQSPFHTCCFNSLNDSWHVFECRVA